MLTFFAWGQLPGQDPTVKPEPYLATDVTSFGDLWLVADTLQERCSNLHNLPGWVPVGMYFQAHS